MMTIATTVPHPELSVSSMLSPFLRDNNPIKKIIPKRTPIPIINSIEKLIIVLFKGNKYLFRIPLSQQYFVAVFVSIKGRHHHIGI